MFHEKANACAFTLLAALLLAACDGPAEEAPVTYDPLPDPNIEWRPIVEQLFEEGPCGAIWPILTLMQLKDARAAADYANDLEALAPCGEAMPGLYAQTAASLREGADSDPFSAHQDIRRLRDFVGTPTARAFQIQQYRDLQVVLSDRLRSAERHWVAHCEGPLELRTGNAYRLRQLMASELNDDQYLIPEWDERISQCIPIGADLAQHYENLLAQQARAEAIELVADTLGEFQVTLRILAGSWSP